MISRAFIAPVGAALLMASAAIAAPSDLDNRSVLLETERGAFTFDAAVCGIHLEDDFYDIEAYGPGTGPDGEVVFFELSSTGDHLTVGFGVSSIFESPDKKIDASGLNIVVSGNTIFVNNLVLYEEGETGHGSLTINCS